jgi:hypothetical protein
MAAGESSIGGADYVSKLGPDKPSRPSASAPAARKATPSASASGASRSSGGSKLDALIKAIDDIEIADQHDLNAFCEAGRKLAHYLAVQTALAGGEIEAGVKEMAKNSGGSRWSMTGKIRRVTKRLYNAADHFGSAGADFVGAWTTFEQVFADLLEASESKTKTHKRFTIK